MGNKMNRLVFTFKVDLNPSNTTFLVYTNSYSYKSVAFVLEHLYEPKLVLGSDYNLVEIMALSDMMGIQTLLNLICSTIITRICHNFHKVLNNLK